jgi:uncharacterized membrane protein YoaK (UPF0700 family)
MKMTWQRSEVLFTLCMVVILAAALLASRGWSQRAGLFPWVVLVPTLLLAVWQLIDDVRGKTTPPTLVIGDEGEATELDQALTSEETARRGGVLVAWILGFLGIIWVLGWAIGGGLASAAYLRIAWHERWRVAIIYGVVTYLFVEILFRELLNIPFDEGMLFETLGWDLRLRR